MSDVFNAATADAFVGEIRTFAFGFVPDGWAACAGQLLQIEQNTELFALIGTAHGGDGQTTFALPDMRGQVKTVAGADLNLCIAVIGVWPPRN